MGEEAANLKQLPHWPTATHTALKLCDSCKSSTASLFCRNDSAFLCIPCDSKIHAANKLASRHARVWMCEVCEQAPAHVTCKADAAALCVSCDRDIHSANPLARRHERFPVVPFYDSATDAGDHGGGGGGGGGANLNQFFTCEDEEEAASWLMPNLNSKLDDPDLDLDDPDQAQTHHVNFNNIYSEVDPYLDFGPQKDFVKQDLNDNSSGADGVVPEHCSNHNNDAQQLLLQGGDGFGVDFVNPAKGFPCFHSAAAANNNNNQQNHNHSISHSVSSSSHEVGVVPDGGAMIDVTNPYGRGDAASTVQAVALSGAEREARVLRYREKRKNRKFEKTIRYASRKAYAETRPRIKGRFAKRTDGDVAVEDQMYDMNSPAIGSGDLHAGYGVVPSY